MNHGLRTDNGRMCADSTGPISQIFSYGRLLISANTKQGKKVNKQGNAVMKAAICTGFSMLQGKKLTLAG